MIRPSLLICRMPIIPSPANFAGCFFALLIPPPRNLSEFHARGGRGLQRVAPRDSHPPSLIENDTGSYLGLISFAEQSGEAVCPRFARAKRESVVRRRFARAKRERRPRRRTSPEQSRKVHRAAGLRQSKVGKSTAPPDFARAKQESVARRASPKQSGKARARRLSQSKAQKPATALSQSKAEKCGPRAGPETFPEQSAKGGRLRACIGSFPAGRDG